MINLIFSITIVISTIVAASHFFQLLQFSDQLQGPAGLKEIQENKALFFVLQLMKTLCANEFFKDGKLMTQEEIFKTQDGYNETDLSDAEKKYIFQIVCNQLCLSHEFSGVIKYKLSTPMNDKLRAQLQERP